MRGLDFTRFRQISSHQIEVGPVQDRVDIDGNRLGDLVTPVCGSRTVWVDDVRSPPGKIVSGRFFFWSPSTWSSGILGQKEGLPIQDHSMYFAVELCILLRNYVYVAAELHFHIVAGARRALVLNGNWS